MKPIEETHPSLKEHRHDKYSDLIMNSIPENNHHFIPTDIIQKHTVYKQVLLDVIEKIRWKSSYDDSNDYLPSNGESPLNVVTVEDLVKELGLEEGEESIDSDTAKRGDEE